MPVQDGKVGSKAKRTGVRLIKLLQEGPSGWCLLVRAQSAVVRAALVVRQRPQGDLFREIAKPDSEPVSVNPEDRARIRRIGNAVERVARLGAVRGRCLVRSLAIQDLADREGISGLRIRVGVRVVDGRFQAHAWPEWDGVVIGDHPDHVAAFDPLPDPGNSTGRKGTLDRAQLSES